ALADKTFSEVRRLLGPRIRIPHVIRGEGVELVRLPSLTIRPGDRLSVRGTPESIKAVEALFGPGSRRGASSIPPDQRLVELIVTRESPLYNRKLSELRQLFEGRLSAAGLYRPDRNSATRLDDKTDPTLRVGDILLVQGDRTDIERLKEEPLMLILDRTVHVPRTMHAGRAVMILIAVVVVAATGILPIMVSALLGVAMMLLARCIAWHEVWSALDARLVMLIVTSLALGGALVVTGAADFIAAAIVSVIRDLPPPVILAALMLLFSLLTEVVTNNSVAVLGTPIAINIAQNLGLPELPFVLTVLFGANMSFMTPIGYQTNLLVMGAGGYRFSDFFRAGAPLQLILWLMLSYALTLWFL
ncbi:MAG: SLC13 family permease, partial [Woeseiaceae bacterium]|nr:SLC13 family permease [Woeseiaceae bacterium]